MDALPLAGRTVAVPETRELEVFAGLLERRGARVLRCPMVSILDAPDPAPVLKFARDFAGGACDDLILTTGEGLRRLLGCIDRHEPALRPRQLLAGIGLGACAWFAQVVALSVIVSGFAELHALPLARS